MHVQCALGLVLAILCIRIILNTLHGGYKEFLIQTELLCGCEHASTHCFRL